MTPPTHEDAVILVSLSQWGTALGIQEAIPELFADDFNTEEADAMESSAVRIVLVYGETIATLTKHGLLSAELVADWLWMEGIWARVAPAVRKARDRFNEPKLYSNLEALAVGGT